MANTNTPGFLVKLFCNPANSFLANSGLPMCSTSFISSQNLENAITPLTRHYRCFPDQDNKWFPVRFTISYHHHILYNFSWVVNTTKSTNKTDPTNYLFKSACVGLVSVFTKYWRVSGRIRLIRFIYLHHRSHTGCKKNICKKLLLNRAEIYILTKLDIFQHPF